MRNKNITRIEGGMMGYLTLWVNPEEERRKFPDLDMRRGPKGHRHIEHHYGLHPTRKIMMDLIFDEVTGEILN